MDRYLALPVTFWSIWAQWWFSFMGSAASASQKSKTSVLRLWHTPGRIKLMRELVEGVRAGDSPFEYVGLPMTTMSARDAAAFSNDRNPHHVGDEFFPPFNEHIAHGVHGFTEAMIAFWLFLAAHGIAIRPKGVKIEFHQPVFLRGSPLDYDIYPPTPENPRQYSIEAHTLGNTLDDAKPVIVITIDVEDGTMSQNELEYHLFCGWLISSLLAREWPKCLFKQFTLSFGEAAPKEESTAASIRVTKDYNKKDRQHIVGEVTAGVGTVGETHIVLMPLVAAVAREATAIQPGLRLVA